MLSQQLLFSVYTHSSRLNFSDFEPSSVFRGTLLPDQGKAEWGDTTGAVKVLLTAALQDSMNSIFVLLSDSDVPLYPARLTYMQLIQVRIAMPCLQTSNPLPIGLGICILIFNTSWQDDLPSWLSTFPGLSGCWAQPVVVLVVQEKVSRVDGCHAWNFVNLHRYTCAMAEDGIDIHHWRKSNLFMLFIRKHAQLFRDDTKVYESFQVRASLLSSTCVSVGGACQLFDESSNVYLIKTTNRL